MFHDARSPTDDEVDFELKSKQRSVPRNISPVRFSIEERPYNKEVYVIQPKVEEEQGMKGCCLYWNW